MAEQLVHDSIVEQGGRWDHPLMFLREVDHPVGAVAVLPVVDVEQPPGRVDSEFDDIPFREGVVDGGVDFVTGDPPVAVAGA